MKKDAVQSYRISEDQRASMNLAAKEFGTSAAQLTSLLVENFLRDYEKCGKNICWPPEFKGQAAKRRSLRFDFSVKVTFRDGPAYREASRMIIVAGNPLDVDGGDLFGIHGAYAAVIKNVTVVLRSSFKGMEILDYKIQINDLWQHNGDADGDWERLTGIATEELVIKPHYITSKNGQLVENDGWIDGS